MAISLPKDCTDVSEDPTRNAGRAHTVSAAALAIGPMVDVIFQPLMEKDLDSAAGASIVGMG